MTTKPKRAYGMKGAKKKDVYLDPASIEKALKLGDGNLSAGVRLAIKSYFSCEEVLKLERKYG